MKNVAKTRKATIRKTLTADLRRLEKIRKQLIRANDVLRAEGLTGKFDNSLYDQLVAMEDRMVTFAEVVTAAQNERAALLAKTFVV